MSDLAKLEEKFGTRLDELAEENRTLRKRLEAIPTGGGVQIVDDQVKAQLAAEKRDRAIEKRLAAKKEAYIFYGRSALVPVRKDAQEGPGTETTLESKRRGEKIRFDPGDGGGERLFRYGDPMHLSSKDVTALRKSGYSLQPANDPQELPLDDSVAGAIRALEEEDYHEATRILRDEHAMPRDSNGNVVKTKPEVMTALGEWLDDRMKG